MKNTKPKVRLWSVLTGLTAILTVAAIVGNIIANQYATTINVALNASTYKIIHGENTGDTEYFKKGFASDEEREAYEAELCATVEAEGAALLYMAVKHLLSRRAFAQVAQDESAAVLSRKRIAIRLATISIPITLGACIVPLAGWIDSFMLTNLMEGGGMDTTEALVRYGLYSGMVLTLINVPTALAMAMSTNLVPAISAGMARGDREYVSRESITGLRIAAVIGFPCAVGMSILAKPILFLFYSGSYTAEHLTIAGKLLQTSAMTIGLFTMVQATSGILQGCGKQRIPMYTLLAGVACKVLLNFLLVRIPALNIHGAPIASLVCYTVSMAPNLYYVVKYAARRFPVTDIVLRPLAAKSDVTLTCLMSDGVTVRASEDDIYHIVFNLVENAIKYNLPGGSVTVRVEARGEQSILSVADTGIGIPEADRPNIFNRFYRVDKARSREHGGSGLGLSIVHDAAALYGGTVTVDGVEPHGTRFTVTFPRAKADNAPEVQKEVPET